ncbi:hypothetical protein ACFL3B_05265 [Gemmatimonadota bacterium]
METRRMIRYPILLVYLSLSPLAIPSTIVQEQNGACVTGPFPWANLLTLAVVIGAICTVFNRVLTEFLRPPGGAEALRSEASDQRAG